MKKSLWLMIKIKKIEFEAIEIIIKEYKPKISLNPLKLKQNILNWIII